MGRVEEYPATRRERRPKLIVRARLVQALHGTYPPISVYHQERQTILRHHNPTSARTLDHNHRRQRRSRFCLRRGWCFTQGCSRFSSHSRCRRQRDRGRSRTPTLILRASAGSQHQPQDRQPNKELLHGPLPQTHTSSVQPTCRHKGQSAPPTTHIAKPLASKGVFGRVGRAGRTGRGVGRGPGVAERKSRRFRMQRRSRTQQRRSRVHPGLSCLLAS